MKSVRIRSFSGPYFPAFELMQIDTPHLSVFSPNAGKYWPEKKTNTDTFHAVKNFGGFLLSLLKQGMIQTK